MTDTKVVYLYIKDFKYQNEEEKEELGGHPYVGRVYRAFKQLSPKLYRLYIGQENNPAGVQGLAIRSLKSNNSSWSCNIIEITPENIAELNITDQDLENIAIWDSTNNSDILTHDDSNKDQTEEPMEIISIDQLKEMMSNQELELPEVKTKMVEWPEFEDSVYDLIEYLDSTFTDKYANSPISTKGLILDENLGKGFNMGNANKYISRYCTVGFEKSENPKDLLKAIHYLLFELTRVNTLKKNNE